MYDIFLNGSVVENLNKNFNLNSSTVLIDLPQELLSLYHECGYCSFNNGLYRVYKEDIAMKWKEIIEHHFPEYKNRLFPFASDWMGRQFAVDSGFPKFILVFDPSRPDVYLQKNDLASFHNEALLDKKEDILDENGFKVIKASMQVVNLPFNQCIGFKTPLFIGGKDELSNLEVTDIEVYWEIQLQIYAQIKDLPPGTRIDSIKFTPRK